MCGRWCDGIMNGAIIIVVLSLAMFAVSGMIVVVRAVTCGPPFVVGLVVVNNECCDMLDVNTNLREEPGVNGWLIAPMVCSDDDGCDTRMLRLPAMRPTLSLAGCTNTAPPPPCVAPPPGWMMLVRACATALVLVFDVAAARADRFISTYSATLVIVASMVPMVPTNFDMAGVVTLVYDNISTMNNGHCTASTHA